jgi:hypothetical protein
LSKDAQGAGVLASSRPIGNRSATVASRQMGYAEPMRFPPEDLALLDETEEIEIETAMPGAQSHRTIIWIVVDGDDVFVRSVRGSRARWYQEAAANPAVTIHAGHRALSAIARAAADEDSIARMNAGLERKYKGISGFEPMLLPDIFDTTLKITPA